MALPSNQVVTGILRRWTAARGISAGNSATVQNTRHPIPPGESMAEAGQDICPHRAGHPAGHRPDSGRVRGSAGSPEAKHRLEEAASATSQPGADSLRRHMAEHAARGGTLCMNIHRLMPELECENDTGGCFTKYPLSDSHSMTPSPLVFSSLYASVPESSLADRAKRRRTGATPLSEALARAWGGVGFHKRRTAPLGVAPV